MAEMGKKSSANSSIKTAVKGIFTVSRWSNEGVLFFLEKKQGTMAIY